MDPKFNSKIENRNFRKIRKIENSKDSKIEKLKIGKILKHTCEDL